jgi:hypothetical protein
MRIQRIHRIYRTPLLVLACLCFLPGSPTAAATPDPADFPLRVHIYHVSNHSHRWRGMLEWVGGEGRANLYENGMPAGLEFAYRCGEKFMHSEDYETIPARWKKPGYSLIVLAHPIGSDHLTTCEWKVDVKEFAYARVNGHVITEPAADLQHWMQLHQYDPEHRDAPPADLPYNSTAHP